jgi:hypothetical protein
VASLALSLGVLESALRLRADGFWRPPPRGARLDMTQSAYPARYDAELGYAPRPGASGRDNVWGTEVNIDADGLRSNGATQRPSGPPILALGDSFTFGDEVEDAASWPAHLERILGRPVWNAGVFGYGLDQAVLRGERIVARMAPEAPALVVVSVIGETVTRCGYAYRYAPKPWFALEGDGLALNNVPARPPQRTRSPLETLAQHSHLANFVLRRIDPNRWALPDSVSAHADSQEVAERLVARLRDLGRERGFDVLLVGQMVPGRDNAPARRLLRDAETIGVATLPIEVSALTDRPSDRDELAHLFIPTDVEPFAGRHMTSAGNAAVARAIAKRVRGLRGMAN